MQASPAVVLCHGLSLRLEKRIRLTLPGSGGSRIVYMLKAPGALPERFSNQFERISFPIANSTKANDEASILPGYQRCVVPDLLELSSEGFGTHVVELPTHRVIDMIRASHEPVSQPLVLYVGSHAVV